MLPLYMHSINYNFLNYIDICSSFCYELWLLMNNESKNYEKGKLFGC